MGMEVMKLGQLYVVHITYSKRSLRQLTVHSLTSTACSYSLQSVAVVLFYAHIVQLP